MLSLAVKNDNTMVPRPGCTGNLTQDWHQALFTIARTWKQPRCPSTDEWIKNLWYIYTAEYYSVIKRNAFESVLL